MIDFKAVSVFLVVAVIIALLDCLFHGFGHIANAFGFGWCFPTYYYAVTRNRDKCSECDVHCPEPTVINGG